MPRPARGDDDAPQYRPISARRRVLIVLLAIATAVTVVLMLLDPPGGVQRTRPVPAAQQPCAPGQTENCVGGKADVIVTTPASAARP